MTHFGIICPAGAGHLNPMTTLGYELKQRGHRVTVVGVEDAKSKVLSAELEFQVIGQSDFPKGAIKQLSTKLGNLSGFAAMKYSFTVANQQLTMSLNECPKAIKASGIELLIVDQAAFWGGTVAEYLEIPFVSVANALLFNIENSVPPIFTTWSYRNNWWAYLRNQLAYWAFIPVAQTTNKIIDSYRCRWSLPLHSYPNNAFSKLAQLSQQPRDFEFPRKKLPSVFHFTGPYINPASREAASFPFEKLTGQPIIYASLGTVQNRLLWIFQMIAEACVGLDVQLVIALGGGATPESLPDSLRNGKTLVVGYAPQLELLQKATLCITHAGMNTTLESLSNGVPMVAIPITNDQPGVAARIAWTRTGEIIHLSKVSVEKLHGIIKKVLAEDSYRKNALRLQKAIEQAGGVSRAADIVEKVVSTGKPVFSHTHQHQ